MSYPKKQCKKCGKLCTQHLCRGCYCKKGTPLVKRKANRKYKQMEVSSISSQD